MNAEQILDAFQTLDETVLSDVDHVRRAPPKKAIIAIKRITAVAAVAAVMIGSVVAFIHFSGVHSLKVGMDVAAPESAGNTDGFENGSVDDEFNLHAEEYNYTSDEPDGETTKVITVTITEVQDDRLIVTLHHPRKKATAQIMINDFNSSSYAVGMLLEVEYTQWDSSVEPAVIYASNVNILAQP